MTEWRNLRRLIGANQLQVAERSGVSKLRLSGAETGLWSLEPWEARAVGTALTDLARERSASLLIKLREAE